MSKHKLIPALESNSTEVIISLEDQEASLDFLQHKEDEMQDIEELSVGIEEALSGIETLSDVQDTLETSIEEGSGIDETGAALTEIAVESICMKLGFHPTYKPVPAVESFGTKDNITATKIAIEGIKDTISKIWNAIKSGFSKLVDKVVNFLDDLNKNIKPLQAKLSTVEHEISQLSTKGHRRSETIDNKVIIKAFSYGKESNFETATKVLSNTKTLVDNAPKISEALKDYMMFTVEWIETTKQNKDEKIFDKNSEKHFKKFRDVFDLTMQSVQTKDIDLTDEHGQVYGPYVNNYFLGIDRLTAEDITLGRTRVKILNGNGVANNAEALDINQMKKLAKITKELLSSFSAWQSVAKDLEASVTAAENLSIQSMVSIGTTTDNLLFQRYAFIKTFTTLCGMDMPELSYKAVKHSIEYLMACIANWEQTD